MTIVASNSLTLSKVNDGSITHTAWSYSADGTDRFTTVYPNLNLGDNTKTFVGAEGGNNLTGSIRIDSATQKTQDGDINYLTFKPTRDGFDWFRFFLIPDIQTPNMTKVAVKPNTKYTFSVFLKGTGQHTIYAYQNWTAPNTPWFFGINLTSDWKLYTFTVISSNVIPDRNVQFFIRSNNGTEINLKYPKVEPGSIATPYMLSSSEVTTADWPKYIGRYTDFMQADSTNPSDYTWGPMRGDDGVGVTSTVITYANSTSGTTAPSTGWTSSIPSPVKGQYLWTKTVWTSTDTSSKTAYSVSYNSKDGTNGTNGTSGIIVSSVAPNSPQDGQLWQDISTTPQLVKKWSGSSWVIWKMYVENMVVDTISSMSSDLGNMIGGTLKLMDDDMIINGQPKMYGIYQSKLGLLSSGPVFDTSAIVSDTQMGVVNLNRGELRFIVTDYTENLEGVQEAGMSDQNNAFIKFASYENGKDVMTIGSSGDIVFKGNTSQDTPWVTLSSGVKYKFMFSRVYISVDIVGNGSTFMQFGMLPQNLRPISDQFLIIANWGTGTADDRHIMVRASDGAVILWAPKSGVTYAGEVSFTL